MPSITPRETAREIDTKLADLYGAELEQERRLSMYAETAKHQAGAEFYYRGRRRITDMSTDKAEAKLTEALAAHDLANPDDHYGYARIETGATGHVTVSAVRRTLAGLASARERLAEIHRESAELARQYTGWPRFFLVTSSQGHIHNSMNCSTCRPSTTYGWLPELSGAHETEAVEAHGPALCSVCFPSAPVEFTQTKLSKRAATAAAR